MGGGYNDDADDRYLRAFTSWDMLDEFVYVSRPERGQTILGYRELPVSRVDTQL